MFKFLIVLFLLFTVTVFSKKISLEDKEKIFKKADDIMLKISKYGERKPNLTVKKSLTSKVEIIKYLEGEIKLQYKDNQFLAEEQVLKLMGLINKNVDYEKAIKDVLSQEVAGYYNPKNNTMYIADWISIEMQEIVLAHELFHAVQKQNYKIMDEYMKTDNTNSDKKLAISSILEGEATAIMMDYEIVIKKGSFLSFDKIPALEFMLNMSMAMNPSSSFNKYSKYPQVMMSIMVFPYIKGLLFLKYFKKKGGWKAVDNIYKRMPISTEQILHIDKYLSNEKPMKIKFKNKKKFLDNCKYVNSSMFGEAFLYTIFKDDKLDKTNIEAAAGWNGDKIFIYKCKKEYLGIFISEWDSKKDAHEFLVGIKNFLDSSIVSSNYKPYHGFIKNKKVVLLLNFTKNQIEKSSSKF